MLTDKELREVWDDIGTDDFLSWFGDISLRLPDFTAPDYFYWGIVKNKLFETRTATILELKQRIRMIAEEIP